MTRARVLAVAQSAGSGGAELALARLARELPSHGFDVEIASGLALGGLEAGGWPRAVLAWPRARRLARSADLVWLNGLVAQRLAPALGDRPLAPYVHDFPAFTPRPWRSERFWRRTPVVLCNSQAVAERAASLGAPAERLRVVHAPVDAPAPAPRPDWADGTPVVGFAGRIEPRKGVLDLVRAAREVDARFVIAGADDFGTEAGYVRAVRDEAGENVSFLGRVEDAAGLMEWFDVLALPSHEEPFGLAAAEALAAGTPVVASRCGGPEEFIVSGVNGELVPVGDPPALAAALRATLTRAPAMAAAARESAARFATARVAADVAEAFREALEGRR